MRFLAVLSAEVNEMGSKANFDAVQKRKKQRTKNNLKKLLLFLLIAAFCGYLYLQRDVDSKTGGHRHTLRIGNYTE